MVRDFIYLDTDRVHSYLSQIEGGFKLFVQKVESAIKEEEERFEDASALLSLLLSASGGGGFGPFAHAESKFSAQLDLGAPGRAASLRTGQTASNVATVLLHHYAFQIVYERMGDRLVTIQGKASLLPAGDFMALAGEFGEADPRDIEIAKKLGMQNILYVESSDDRGYALLLEEHFLVSPMHFLLTYGAPTTRDFTLVGIDAGPRSFRRAPIQAEGLARAMFEMTRDIEQAIKGLIGDPPGKSIYPLAVFSDL